MRSHGLSCAGFAVIALAVALGSFGYATSDYATHFYTPEGIEIWACPVSWTVLPCVGLPLGLVVATGIHFIIKLVGKTRQKVPPTP